MKYDVSIIVPIYNVSAHIERCMHSLFKQTFDDIEFVLVNDCTPDDSMSIVNDVMMLYPNRVAHTTIINNEINRGVSSTRNVGLDYCNGDYVIQIDSDDYVEVDMIEKMYDYAIKYSADIVVADSYSQWKTIKEYKKEIIPSNGRIYAKDIITGKCMPAIWNKLIKTSLFKDNSIRFPDGINMGEDLATIPRVAYLAQNIVKIDTAFVHYVHYNNSSYSNNINYKSISDLQYNVQILHDFFLTFDDIELISALKIRLITTKCIILINSDLKNRRKYCNLYTELDEFIFKAEGLPYYYKGITWLYSKNIFILADILMFLVLGMKMIKRTIFDFKFRS